MGKFLFLRVSDSDVNDSIDDYVNDDLMVMSMMALMIAVVPMASEVVGTSSSASFSPCDLHLE